jgi:hypothetical protein
MPFNHVASITTITATNLNLHGEGEAFRNSQTDIAGCRIASNSTQNLKKTYIGITVALANDKRVTF